MINLHLQDKAARDCKHDAERKPDAHPSNASGLAESGCVQASGVAVARRAGTR
jgi:hypothetical protein